MGEALWWGPVKCVLCLRNKLHKKVVFQHGVHVPNSDLIRSIQQFLLENAHKNYLYFPGVTGTQTSALPSCLSAGSTLTVMSGHGAYVDTTRVPGDFTVNQYTKLSSYTCANLLEKLTNNHQKTAPENPSSIMSRNQL